MNLLLADLLDKCVLVYMDDILIYSKMVDDQVAHVKAVFEHLVAKNWHVKEKKCALFLQEVEFLGHMVSAEGVKVVVVKIDAVSSWPTPTCVREVQGFLGLVIFYRRFMKGFMAIAKPMTNLMRKDKDFMWGTEEEATFLKLKETLTSAPILQVFDEDKLHEVWVDASDYVVGTMLV